MPVKPVFDGEFLCLKCEQEYRAEGAVEEELRCPSCGAKLVEVNDEDDDGGGSET